MRQTTSDKLRTRLQALGYNVGTPRRIWIGSSRSSDLWKWEAIEKGTSNITRWGAAMSMAECLKITDEHFRILVDRN